MAAFSQLPGVACRSRRTINSDARARSGRRAVIGRAGTVISANFSAAASIYISTLGAPNAGAAASRGYPYATQLLVVEMAREFFGVRESRLAASLHRPCRIIRFMLSQAMGFDCIQNFPTVA